MCYSKFYGLVDECIQLTLCNCIAIVFGILYVILLNVFSEINSIQYPHRLGYGYRQHLSQYAEKQVIANLGSFAKHWKVKVSVKFWRKYL